MGSHARLGKPSFCLGCMSHTRGDSVDRIPYKPEQSGGDLPEPRFDIRGSVKSLAPWELVDGFLLPDGSAGPVGPIRPLVHISRPAIMGSSVFVLSARRHRRPLFDPFPVLSPA